MTDIKNDRGFSQHLAQLVWMGAQVLNWGANIDFFVKVHQKHVDQELNNDLLYFYSIYILFISTIITYPLIYMIGKICILRRANFLTEYLLYLVFFCPSYMLATLLIQQVPQMVITSFYLNEFEFTYSFFQGIITIIIAIWEIYMTTRDIDLEQVVFPKLEEQKKMIAGVVRGFNPIIFIFFLTNTVFSHHPLFLYCYWYATGTTILPENMSLLPPIIILGIFTGLMLILQASLLTRRCQEFILNSSEIDLEKMDQAESEEAEQKMLKYLAKVCGYITCFFCLYTVAFIIMLIYLIESFKYVTNESNTVDSVAELTILVNFWGFISIVIINCFIGYFFQCKILINFKEKLETNA